MPFPVINTSYVIIILPRYLLFSGSVGEGSLYRICGTFPGDCVSCVPDGTLEPGTLFLTLVSSVPTLSEI